MLVCECWNPLWALTLTVTLLHFWYDGFVWSVRRPRSERLRLRPVA